MPKPVEMAHAVLGGMQHAVEVAGDAVSDSAKAAWMHVEPMPAVQDIVFKAERIARVLDGIGDRLWDKLSKH